MITSTVWFQNGMILAAGALACAACAGSPSMGRTTAPNSARVAQSGAGPISDAVPDEHAAVTDRLKTTEEEACAEVPAADRDFGPLAPRGRISSVEPLSERPHPKEFAQLSGAAVYLRAAPGLTQEWLSHVLTCHIAHHALVGDRAPDASSPLFVADARIAVSSTGDGFRIAITTSDVDGAREIIERARALVQ